VGYWLATPEGYSLLGEEIGPKDLVWGDTPADAMDDALELIIAAFRKDLGRAPTMEELKAGLLFSAQTSLEVAQKRRETAGLYTFVVMARWTFTGFDGENINSEEPTYFDAPTLDEARAMWVAERDLNWERDEAAGITRTFLSIEPLEKPRPSLTLVKGTAKD